MRATVNSLTAQQQKTLIYIVGTVLLLGAAGYMYYSLSAGRTEARRQRQEIERKENEARNVQMPSLEVQTKWAEQETQLGSLLLTDQTVPKFYEEISGIATENRLQRVDIKTDETTIDANKQPSAEEAQLLGVGVRRYLVMTVRCQGEYPDIARFLSGISKLNRPVEFQLIDIRRSTPYIDVTVVMKVYKREPA